MNVIQALWQILLNLLYITLHTLRRTNIIASYTVKVRGGQVYLLKVELQIQKSPAISEALNE